MKEAFQEKPNPDANDLKNLSTETGLSKRVLQVWFQNARAKQRKISHEQNKGESINTSSSSDSFEPNWMIDNEQILSNETEIKSWQIKTQFDTVQNHAVNSYGLKVNRNRYNDNRDAKRKSGVEPRR